MRGTTAWRQASGRRPRKPESFHGAVRPPDLQEYEGNWDVVREQLDERQGSQEPQ